MPPACEEARGIAETRSPLRRRLVRHLRHATRDKAVGGVFDALQEAVLTAHGRTRRAIASRTARSISNSAGTATTSGASIFTASFSVVRIVASPAAARIAARSAAV